ncbi:MAG: hypothetical protein M1824_005857 [Vezdaea acicularis]|nr:MAG: hypothetical protein M1824_005857 [Vezdaea acicularis]
MAGLIVGTVMLYKKIREVRVEKKAKRADARLEALQSGEAEGRAQEVQGSQRNSTESLQSELPPAYNSALANDREVKRSKFWRRSKKDEPDTIR